MDIRMPVTDGISAARRIVGVDPAVRILAITTLYLDEHAFGALRARARGRLLKDVGPTEPVAAIRTVASGDAAMSPRITGRLLDEYTAFCPPEATKRPGQNQRGFHLSLIGSEKF